MTLSRISNKDDLNSQSKEIGGRSIRHSMILFLIPMILSNVLQSIGQLAGSIIVGRWLGVDALAAISAFFPLFFLLVSFTIGIGSGSSILIGQAYGARNEERLKAIVGTTLTFTFLLGLVLAILGGIFTWDILRLIGTPDCGYRALCADLILVHAHYVSVFCIYYFHARDR